MPRRRHRHNDHDDSWMIWLMIIVFIIFVSNSDDDEEKEMPEPPATQQQKRMIEGVVQQMIPAIDGVTIVVFDDGYQHKLHLGDHEVYVGEWNQLRINHEGYVEEVWLGENSIQDTGRQ